MILIPLLVVLDDRCVWSVGVETWSVGRASERVGQWSVVVGGSEVQQLLLVPARTVRKILIHILMFLRDPFPGPLVNPLRTVDRHSTFIVVDFKPRWSGY